MGKIRMGKAKSKIRLRDFVKAKGCFFSVVGYRNEDRIKCFLRYIPSDKGDRVKSGLKYLKLDHNSAVKVAEKFDLFYNSERGIFFVPYDFVEEIYKPEERVGELNDEEVEKILKFFENIPKSKMGVTGSRLIGLKGEESDVDFVMYGRYWFLGQRQIRNGIESGKLSEPDEDIWDFIFNKRKVNIPYDIFVAHERRKFHRAVIGGTYFDLLYVRDYDELDRQIPEDIGVKIGKTTITAKVVDDRYSFDYPACYYIDHPDIRAILSFTHTYVGQGRKGELIEAKGFVEEIEGDRYLIVGTSREVRDEYIVSLTFLEKASLLKEFEVWKEVVA